MKVKTVGIKGFRGYSSYVEFSMSNLLVLVGRNDIGKSTVLEALDIFFNENKGSVKLDEDDINKANIEESDDSVEISVEFDELPESLVLDATNETTLADEYLLTTSGTLKIIKRYKNAGREKVYIFANHPTAPGCNELLLKKRPELQKLLEEQGLDCNDKNKAAELRRAIRNGQEALDLQEIEIEAAQEGAKEIWDRLKPHMPLYSLFQADRENNDDDNEIQNPMRSAVRQILGSAEVQHGLEQIANTVKDRLDEVATLTLEKLNEMNPDVASTFSPQIPQTSSLKWNDVFKNVSIAGEDDILINKRGSGVKRLVLISFFRAEAERRRQESRLPSIIYAIEEPETSQHPKHQRALISALVNLSEAEGTQILLTTHSPKIVKQLNFEDLLLITGQQPHEIKQIQKGDLPYPSLNEVNFTAFEDASSEYHNELYGFIDGEGQLENFKDEQADTRLPYINDRSREEREITLTEYIRHQIHHPENKFNERFTDQQLRQSIEAMRSFIQINQLIVVDTK